jgi:adiponectin receptor
MLLQKMNGSACYLKSLRKTMKSNDGLNLRRADNLESCAVGHRMSIFTKVDLFVTGCVAFIGVATYFLTRPSVEIQLQEKLVFAAFFAGAILCLGLSFAFHTVHCHSECVGKLFSK